MDCTDMAELGLKLPADMGRPHDRADCGRDGICPGSAEPGRDDESAEPGRGVCDDDEFQSPAFDIFAGTAPPL